MKTLLRRGTVIDGTGGERFEADVLMDGGRIEAVGAIDTRLAGRVMDVQGLCVAPGFIDAHSHNDWFAWRADSARFFLPFVRQGITTQVTGNCGFSPFGYEAGTPYRHLLGSGLFRMPEEAEGGLPGLAGYSRCFDRLPVHIVPLYGHMSGRISVSGNASRALDEGGLARLDGLMEQAFSDGAAGISLGLMYEPDRYAPRAELVRAARVAARHGKILAVHGRALSAVSTSYQPPVGGRPHNLRALDEMIGIARETGVKLQYSHLIFVGSRSWRTADKALEMIYKARGEGLDIQYDSYAMTYGASIITVVLPPWYLALPREKRASPAARARVALEVNVTKMMLGFDFDDIQMAWVADGQEALCGKTVHEIAREWKTNDLDAYLRLVDLSGGKGRVLMRKYLTPEILDRLMDDPYCLCMTDAWVEEKGVQNAAAYGCFPEFLRLAARRGTLEKTVRQMTGATADRFGITGRGYLKEGYIADITVFDPAQVGASEQPGGRPRGIVRVFRAGEEMPLGDG